MKKLIGIILSITLALSVIGCDNKESVKETSATVNETTTSVDETTTINSNAELEMEGKNYNEKPIDLDGTYDENDILITTLEKKQGRTVMEIPQISGLLDSDIEAKINQDMLETVVNEAENYSKLQNVGYHVWANFSNTISLEVYILSKKKTGRLFLNYNLVDGEKIKFEDLFMEDADILQIIREAFREDLIAYDDNQSYDENELYKIVKGFYNSEEKSFAFTSSDIMFHYKNSMGKAKMINIADSVCIYSKYLTEESIFEKDDIGKKGIYTCTYGVLDSFDIVDFGMLEDNLRYDIAAIGDGYDLETWGIYMEEYQMFKEKKYAEIYQELEAYKEVAKSNPDKFFLIIVRPYIYVTGHSSYNTCVLRRMQIIEMTREKYEEIYKPKLIEAYRSTYFALNEGVVLEITEDDVICEEVFEEEYYNYSTGELIKE